MNQENLETIINRHSSKLLRPETLRDYAWKVYPKLVEVAIARSTIPYNKLMKEFGIHRMHIGLVVGIISETEHMESSPLLSAIVVRKGTNNPGEGFWGLSVSTIPDNLKKAQWEDQHRSLPEDIRREREQFVQSEREKVYEHFFES